jgi:hypothetical protein
MKLSGGERAGRGMQQRGGETGSRVFSVYTSVISQTCLLINDHAKGHIIIAIRADYFNVKAVNHDAKSQKNLNFRRLLWYAEQSDCF